MVGILRKRTRISGCKWTLARRPMWKVSVPRDENTEATGLGPTLYLTATMVPTLNPIGIARYEINWKTGNTVTWSSEPREGPAAHRAKEVPSFLSYFKTLSIGPAPGIELATSRSAVKRSTDWANPAAVPFIYNFQRLSNKCPTIFWSLIFRISLTPQIKLFFVERET